MPCLPCTPGLVKVTGYLIIATFLAQSTGSCIRWRGRLSAVSAVYPWTSQSSWIFDNSDISCSEYWELYEVRGIATFHAQSTGSCMRWRGRPCVVSAAYPWTGTIAIASTNICGARNTARISSRKIFYQKTGTS